MNLQVIETKNIETLIALDLGKLNAFLDAWPFSVQDVTGTGTHFGVFASRELADEELHRLEDAEIYRIQCEHPKLLDHEFADAAEQANDAEACPCGMSYSERFAAICARMAWGTV